MRFADWICILDHNHVKDADAGFEAVPKVSPGL